MKIYTKTGDNGTTGLLGGVRVAKNHPCIDACGTLDELNSWIGVIRSHSSENELNEKLETIQVDLFTVGAAIASCLSDSKKQKGVGVQPNRAGDLEIWMDQVSAALPEQTSFILPGGTQFASWIHLCRNVCRRAERDLVRVLEMEATVRDLSSELVYLNRLSDLLFLLARQANTTANHTETKWLPS